MVPPNVTCEDFVYPTITSSHCLLYSTVPNENDSSVHLLQVSFRYLTIAKRIKIFKEGFGDRSPAVRNLIAKRLLPAWLKACDSSPVRLLKALDVEGFSETCEDATRLLLQRLSHEELEEMVNNFVKEYIRPEK